MKVPHLAWCEYGVCTKRKGEVSKYSEVSNVPHLARVSREFVLIVYTLYIGTNLKHPLSHTLLFMLMTKQKPKFF